MKRWIIILNLFFIGAIPVFAQDTLSAKAVMQKVLDRNDGTTEVSRVRLSTCSVKRKGKAIICQSTPRVKVMDLIRKDYGPREKDHKSVTLILKPAGEKGIGFLQYDYEQKGKETDQWLYLSAMGKVKRIVSGNADEPKTGSFFGSEFSYEDLEKRHLDDYTYTILGEETYQGRPCYVIQALPTPDRARKSNYSKSLEWVDTERDLVLKSILFDRRGNKVKKMYFRQIRTIDSILVPMEIIVLNLDTRRRTIMAYEKVALNMDVADPFLTKRTLIDGVFRESHLKQYQHHLK